MFKERPRIRKFNFTLNSIRSYLAWVSYLYTIYNWEFLNFLFPNKKPKKKEIPRDT